MLYLQFIIIIIIIIINIIIAAAAATTTTAAAAITTHVWCLFDCTDIVIKIFKARNYYATAFMVEIGEKNIDVLYCACS